MKIFWRARRCSWLRRCGAIGFLLITLDGVAFGQECDFSQVDTAVANLVTAVAQLPGAGIRIGTSEAVLHEAFFGTYDASTVVRTASSAKLLSAAAVLSVIDDGLVGLDQPVDSILPEFVGLGSAMSLRQMFSHTSGLPGGSSWPILSDGSVTLAEAVSTIASDIPLEAAPGTQFSYGGLSMHVGGRMVEIADGRLWDDLFAARIASPLGLAVTDYEGLGATNNPRIAGGARTGLGDYGVFLEMLLRDGLHDGTRVLSSAAVLEIFAEQRHGLPAVIAPSGVGDAGYGLGLWRESFDESGQVIRVSDPGAFGFTPWIEMDRRVYGIIMIDWLRLPLLPSLEAIQDLVRSEIDRCDARGPVPPSVPAATTSKRAFMVAMLLLLGVRTSLRSQRIGSDPRICLRT